MCGYETSFFTPKLRFTPWNFVFHPETSFYTLKLHFSPRNFVLHPETSFFTPKLRFTPWNFVFHPETSFYTPKLRFTPWNFVFHPETSFYTLKRRFTPWNFVFHPQVRTQTVGVWEEPAEGKVQTTPWDFQNVQPSPHVKEITCSVDISAELRTGRSEVRILGPIRVFSSANPGFLPGVTAWNWPLSSI